MIERGTEYERLKAVARAICRVQLNGGDPDQPAMRWNGTEMEPQEFPAWQDCRDEARAAIAALIASAPDLLEALKGLLAAYDEERQAIDASPDPHCPECTQDTTPDSFGRKTCAFHLARAAIRRATPAPQED